MPVESPKPSVDPALHQGAEYRARYYPKRGLSIPSITVLDSQARVIESEQRSVFRFNAQRGLGADIIFAAGTNGEWNRIANPERQRLIRIQADEVARINRDLAIRQLTPIEAWAGVTAGSAEETIDNLKCAVEAGAHAAVIAPLSIPGLGDLVEFFQRQVGGLFDRLGRWVPVFLYDNADIAADPRAGHIHTRDVKRLSRLQFIFGIKVSAPRRVLGNYTKGASHFKDKGEFGIYVGDAMLMFHVFRLESGPAGLIKEYWNRYLLHNELPVGVVSGPANVFPREWQRAWRACYAGDDKLMAAYKSPFEQFEKACKFEQAGGGSVSKMIACLKEALRLEGVIESARAAAATPTLTGDEVKIFAERFYRLKDLLATNTDPIWMSRREGPGSLGV
jgi:dihydrodipicolinate synthase/N-acetylneuraminate lyase